MSIQEFQQRVLTLKGQLFGLAYSILGNGPEAEDAVQEAFIKLWNMRKRLEKIENLEGWCVRVLRNLAIDHLRKRPQVAEDIDKRWDLADKTANPHQQLETQDELQHIEHFIEQLPEKQRIIIRLRDIQGYSYQEICEILNMPMSQVKVYLHRARQRLRKLLIQKTTTYKQSS